MWRLFHRRSNNPTDEIDDRDRKWPDRDRLKNGPKGAWSKFSVPLHCPLVNFRNNWSFYSTKERFPIQKFRHWHCFTSSSTYKGRVCLPSFSHVMIWQEKRIWRSMKHDGRCSGSWDQKVHISANVLLPPSHRGITRQITKFGYILGISGISSEFFVS